MILEQEKLDVSNKKRSNLFNWRGQFTPEFVEYILQNFTKCGDHVLDPFSGSGTVLQESARLGLSATGLEINPSAYAMSKFFTFCNTSVAERNKFCDAFEVKLNSSLSSLNGQKIFTKNADFLPAIHEHTSEGPLRLVADNQHMRVLPPETMPQMMEDSPRIRHSRAGHDQTGTRQIIESARVVGRLRFLHVTAQEIPMHAGRTGLSRLLVEQLRMPLVNTVRAGSHRAVHNHGERLDLAFCEQIHEMENHLLGASNRERGHEHPTMRARGLAENVAKFLDRLRE